MAQAARIRGVSRQRVLFWVRRRELASRTETILGRERVTVRIADLLAFVPPRAGRPRKTPRLPRSPGKTP
jgi:hypothetical protein